MNTPEFLTNALTNSWLQFKYVCVIYCVGLMLEAFRPAQADQPLRDISFNIAYAALYLFITMLLLPPLQALTNPWIASWGLALPITFSDNILGQFGQAITFFFIIDFFYYWLHRTQHTLPFLWAQHKIHHSERSLNITTAIRHHWLEEPIRMFAILLPAGLLFKQSPVTIAWLWGALMLWGYFIHMNLRLNMGPLTPVFCGPQLHRIHHSNLAQHRDKNFAAFFPVIDVVFGTYYSPNRNEYPTTGLANGEDLNGLVRASLAPFKAWLKPLNQVWKRPSVEE